MKKILFVSFFIFCFSQMGTAQFFGMGPNTRKVKIPFEYENNFIIVKVKFQNAFPLKFIFDTGAEHTILSKKEISDLLGMRYQRKFTILGSDMKTELHAYLVRGVELGFENFDVRNQSILVLEDDYFQFDEFTGTNVHGIIGASLFQRFIVKINYKRKVITLTAPPLKPKDINENYTTVPVEITKNKPYIRANAYVRPDTAVNVKLLVDTGASLSLLLQTNTHPDLEMPDHVIKGNIGLGLGGFLEGFMGRVERLHIDQFELGNVITNYQEITEDLDTTFLNGRNGIIGNQILDRFTMVLDYPSEKMYLMPNKRLKNSFKYDRSGLVLIASGTHLDHFSVHSVMPNSPAAEAGLRKGDEIRRINGIPSLFLGLEDMIRIFQKRPGKEIHLRIKRNGEKFKKEFKLRNLI